MTSAAQAMAALGALLEGTRLGRLPEAGVIAFDLDGEVWTLSPRPSPVVQRGMTTAPAMTLRCAPDVLLRLLTDEDFTLQKDDELLVLGEPQPLKALMEALMGGASPLATRLSAMATKGRAS